MVEVEVTKSRCYYRIEYPLNYSLVGNSKDNNIYLHNEVTGEAKVVASLERPVYSGKELSRLGIVIEQWLNYGCRPDSVSLKGYLTNQDVQSIVFLN